MRITNIINLETAQKMYKVADEVELVQRKRKLDVTAIVPEECEVIVIRYDNGYRTTGLRTGRWSHKERRAIYRAIEQDQYTVDGDIMTVGALK